MTDRSDEAKEIANRLGSAFAVISYEFLPAVTEALGRSEKTISFGVTVGLKKEGGVITGKIQAHEPKIPTPSRDPVHFCLNRSSEGQLSFLFDGTLREMRSEAQGPRVVDEGYEPSDRGTG
jgi:hypothetical protein